MTKHEQKHMRRAFAVIGDMDYQSENLRYSINQLVEIESYKDVTNLPVSRCGKYAHWQAGKFIVSDVIEVELEYTPVPVEDEIEAINTMINMEQVRSREELERKLDPLKARLTELLAITHNPEV